MGLLGGGALSFALVRLQSEVIGYVVTKEDFLLVMEMHVREGLALLRNVARGVLHVD